METTFGRLKSGSNYFHFRFIYFRVKSCLEDPCDNQLLIQTIKLLREALFTFVGKSKTDVPCVSQSVSQSVRILGDFCEGDMRGGHMPLTSEVLKHRFWKF